MSSNLYKALDLATCLTPPHDDAHLHFRDRTANSKVSLSISKSVILFPTPSVPSELLYMIISEFIASYLDDLFFTPFESTSDWKRLTPNPIPLLLKVSHQFREVTFKVLHDVLEIEREADGT